MSKSLNTNQAPTHEEIAACARQIYEAEGRPEGKALEHWLQAETRLMAERNPQPAELAAKPATGATKSRTTKPHVAKRTRSNLPIATKPNLGIDRN